MKIRIGSKKSKNDPTPKETKLHTSLAALKNLMLIIFPAIIKTQEPHLMRDLLCVSFARERKTQIGWVATIGRRTQR
jgi:hypothetical protein